METTVADGAPLADPAEIRRAAVSSAALTREQRERYESERHDTR